MRSTCVTIQMYIFYILVNVILWRRLLVSVPFAVQKLEQVRTSISWYHVQSFTCRMLNVHYMKQYNSDIADCIRVTWSVPAAVAQIMQSVMKLLKHRGVYNLPMCLRNSCQLGKQIPLSISHCLFRINRACKYELILLQLYNILQIFYFFCDCVGSVE